MANRWRHVGLHASELSVTLVPETKSVLSMLETSRSISCRRFRRPCGVRDLRLRSIIQNLVGSLGGPEHLPGGSENDSPIESERPVFQIINVKSHPVAHVFRPPGFAAETFHLGEAGDAGFDETAEPVAVGDAPKFAVVLDHVRTGSDDAHVAFEDIPELR